MARPESSSPFPPPASSSSSALPLSSSSFASSLSTGGASEHLHHHTSRDFHFSYLALLRGRQRLQETLRQKEKEREREGEEDAPGGDDLQGQGERKEREGEEGENKEGNGETELDEEEEEGENNEEEGGGEEEGENNEEEGGGEEEEREEEEDDEPEEEEEDEDDDDGEEDEKHMSCSTSSEGMIDSRPSNPPDSSLFVPVLRSSRQGGSGGLAGDSALCELSSSSSSFSRSLDLEKRKSFRRALSFIKQREVSGSRSSQRDQDLSRGHDAEKKSCPDEGTDEKNPKGRGKIGGKERKTEEKRRTAMRTRSRSGLLMKKKTSSSSSSSQSPGLERRAKRLHKFLGRSQLGVDEDEEKARADHQGDEARRRKKKNKSTKTSSQPSTRLRREGEEAFLDSSSSSSLISSDRGVFPSSSSYSQSHTGGTHHLQQQQQQHLPKSPHLKLQPSHRGANAHSLSIHRYQQKYVPATKKRQQSLHHHHLPFPPHSHLFLSSKQKNLDRCEADKKKTSSYYSHPSSSSSYHSYHASASSAAPSSSSGPSLFPSSQSSQSPDFLSSFSSRLPGHSLISPPTSSSLRSSSSSSSSCLLEEEPEQSRQLPQRSPPPPSQSTIVFEPAASHPYDQHARHGTHGIVARGVRVDDRGDEEKTLPSLSSAAAAPAAGGGGGAADRSAGHLGGRGAGSSLQSPYASSMSPYTASVNYPQHQQDSSGPASTSSSTAGGSSSASLPALKKTRHIRGLSYTLRDDRPYVCFSCRYRDTFLSLSPDRFILHGYKGWASAFATHCAEKGRWYFEVEILKSEEDSLEFIGINHTSDFSSSSTASSSSSSSSASSSSSSTSSSSSASSSSDEKCPSIHPHWRIGWACRYQKYDLPIGVTAHSFALCGSSLGEKNEACLATDGFKFPLSLLPSSSSTLRPDIQKEGDVIGCFLSLDEPRSVLPDPRRDQKLYEFLQAGILCDPDFPPPPSIDHKAFIEFSINGRRLGRVFQGCIGTGSYHPAVSLYMAAKLKLNPGPEFVYPPDPSENFKPCSEMRRPYIP